MERKTSQLLMEDAANQLKQAATLVNTGASTPGWTDRFPRPGKERSDLYQVCGPDAFLLPNKTSPGQSKFPIVARLSKQSETCKMDCRGVQSAYNRARQHRYFSVAEQAQRILKQDCHKSKH